MTAVVAGSSGGSAGAGRSAGWFPLVVFGVIAALPVPLAAVWPVQTGWTAYQPLTSSVSWTQASSNFFVAFRPGPDGGLAGTPGGWYWTIGLAAGLLLTAVWYWLAGRRAGTARPGWGYLITGLTLTAAVTIVPVLVIPRLAFPAGLWLRNQQANGVLAFGVIAVALGMLARRFRSRPLAIITLIFATATLAADWPALRAAPAVLAASGGDPLRALTSLGQLPQPAQAAMILPALVLLVAALSLALLPRLRHGPPAGPAPGRNT